MLRRLACFVVLAGFVRGQDSRPAADLPVPPFPYRVESVGFENRAAGISFHGTVTAPQAAGRHPAAVLVAGAGGHDRDETVGPQKPLFLIADRLTRLGFVVLRYDKRGVAGTKGDVFQATSADLASDAAAALDYLRTRADVDPQRTGLIGHSEGGMLVFMIAAERPEVAFVVSLAGVAVDCQIAARQFLLQMARAAGVPGIILIPAQLLIAHAVDVVRNVNDRAAAQADLGTFLPAELLPFVLSPWTRFFVRYDPRPAIAKVKCPVLGIYCEHDAMVSAMSNMRALQTTLAAARHPDFDIEFVPGTNHMLQPATKRQALDFISSPHSVAPEIMDQLTTWLTQHIPARR